MLINYFFLITLIIFNNHDFKTNQYPECSEAAELLEILTRFELEGLCFAYDRIVSTVKDFQLSPLKSDHQTITNGQGK